MKSRVQGDFHVRFRENVGVKFPCVTRLASSGNSLFAPVTMFSQSKESTFAVSTFGPIFPYPEINTLNNDKGLGNAGMLIAISILPKCNGRVSFCRA